MKDRELQSLNNEVARHLLALAELLWKKRRLDLQFGWRHRDLFDELAEAGISSTPVFSMTNTMISVSHYSFRAEREGWDLGTFQLAGIMTADNSRLHERVLLVYNLRLSGLVVDLADISPAIWTEHDGKVVPWRVHDYHLPAFDSDARESERLWCRQRGLLTEREARRFVELMEAHDVLSGSDE